MSKKTLSKKNRSLPAFFANVLWSYDFVKIDPEKHKKTIIINSINYGNLKHWRWIANYYGKEIIKEMLEKVSATEIKPRTRRLVSIIFSVKHFNYAPRSTH